MLFLILLLCLARYPGARSDVSDNEGWELAALLTGDTRTVFCGAVLVTPRHALSSAKCTSHPDPLLAVGADIFNGSSSIQTTPVTSITPHEDYEELGAKNDIALVLLERAVVFSEGMGPACLPSGDPDLAGQTVTVVGWSWEDRQETPEPRQLDLSVIPLRECAGYYGLQTQPPLQICTDILNESSPQCQGEGTDGLWPLGLVQAQHGRPVLVGLVSYGLDCSSPTPGVSTRLSAYTDWIQAAIRDSGIPGSLCQIP